MELTSYDLNLIKDQNVLRNIINKLDSKSNKSNEENDLLETLVKYRALNCPFPSLAYYSEKEMETSLLD